MSNQTQHKYDNFARFVSKCKEFVKTIENYNGSDPLEPWYDYLLWLDENFVMNSKTETIFDEILAACLCRFEQEQNYKQDRRLIKLFIKFVHVSVHEQQNEHYDAMIENGFGIQVADLYINWAFHFDVNDNFTRADQIFKQGLAVGAEPLQLLKSAYEKFGYLMSQRMLYKNDETFKKTIVKRMREQLDEIAALRIDGHRPNAPKSMALQMYNKANLMKVCIPREIDPTNRTPEKRHNTSLAQNIIDSARKVRRSQKLSTTACRLNFNESPRESTSTGTEQNLYEKGIQLGRHFKSKNLPQTQSTIAAYSDPEIGAFQDTLPGYDKIMLVPATNTAFSPDELKAFNWFKKRGIVNAFTKEQDKIWGVGYDMPIRWANVFARANFPQPEWIVSRISPSDQYSERGPHRFMCNMLEMYPGDSSEEYSLEEIMWQRRKLVTSRKALSPSKPNRTVNRTNSFESSLSPIVEMELSACGDVLIDVPRRIDGSHPNATTAAEPVKKRKLSIFPIFDALNDTCTTQMFSNLLHRTVISTPKGKMPKYDESFAGNAKEDTKFKLFTDQSSSELLPDAFKQSEKDAKAGFAIYEDKTLAFQEVKQAIGKDMVNTTIGNKENIAIPQNQLINFEQSSGGQIKSEFKHPEVAVIHSNTHRNEKQRTTESKTISAQPSNDFQFDINGDLTETTLKAFENAETILSCTSFGEIANSASVNPKKNPTPQQNTSIEKDIAAVNEMVNSVLNGTKFADKSMFKEPLLPPTKTQSIQRPNETRFCDALDTTEDFERMEAACANSPSEANQSLNIEPVKAEASLAKIVTISAATNRTNTFRLSDVSVTEEERNFILDNPSVCDKTRLNWTRQPSEEHPIIEECVDDDDDEEEYENVGKSIYVKVPEPEFHEKDADWNEVTQFLADVTATNEYKIEEIDLDETQQRIDTRMLNLKDLNPFEPDVQKDVLIDIGFLDELKGANNFNCTMLNIVHPLKPRSSIEINKKKFQIRKLIGTGAFGKVFVAECTKTKETYAFKQQRPPNLWEYYVCLQIHTRIKDEHIRQGFMAVDFAVIGNNATIFASKYSKYGTILNVCNKVKQSTNKSIEECIVMILVKQMITIIDHFHKAKFIHADVKPDNFLLMDKLSMNYENPEIVIQLIDFGQSIDLSYFSNHVFWAKVKTENFICTEMMDDKPWTFHFDYFCLASTIYTMVAGKYMVVSRRTPTDPYKPQKLPRYVNSELWTEILDTLINIPSIRKMPSMAKLQQLLDNELNAIGSKKVTEAIVRFNKALD